MLRTTDPEGHRWTLRRRWLELRRPKWRGARDTFDAGPADLVDDPSGILAAIAIVLVVIFLITVLVPLVIFGGELVIVLVIALAGFGGRLLFGRPWTVEARSDDGLLVERQVAGYRNAGEALQELRAEVEAGRVGAPKPPLPPSPARRGWAAATAIVVALLWAGGIGSVVALVMATAIRRAPESGPRARAGAWVATALGVAGLLLTVLVIAGAISQHQRVG